MSKPLQPLSEDEKVLLRHLMMRAEAEMMSGDFGPSAPVTYDAMTDASKRQLSDGEGESSGEEFERLGMPQSLMEKTVVPVASLKTSSSNRDGKTVFPPGVESFADWGTTLCKLPRVAHLKISYAEWWLTRSIMAST